MIPSNFDKLNKDEIRSLFGQMDGASKKSLVRTEKKMYEAYKVWVSDTQSMHDEALSKLLRDRFESLKTDYPAIQRTFNDIIKACPNCTKLSLETGNPFEGWDFLEDQHLNVLSGNLLNLKEFSLEVVEADKIKITEAQFLALFKSCPKLQKVALPKECLSEALQAHLSKRTIEVISL